MFSNFASTGVDQRRKLASGPMYRIWNAYVYIQSKSSTNRERLKRYSKVNHNVHNISPMKLRSIYKETISGRALQQDQETKSQNHQDTAQTWHTKVPRKRWHILYRFLLEYVTSSTSISYLGCISCFTQQSQYKRGVQKNSNCHIVATISSSILQLQNCLYTKVIIGPVM